MNNARTKWTVRTAAAFGRASAAMAADQRDAYADSVASFRENIIDTLRDEGASGEAYDAALKAYDAATDHA